jgi:dGTPase
MTKSERINNMVINVIQNSGDTILMDDNYWQLFNELHDFMFIAVYKNPFCKSEEAKVVDLIEKLFSYYMKHPDKMPEEFITISENEGCERAVCDYIAGMSDNYCVKVFNQLFVPMFWKD